ncbi:hypothetical protein L2750_16135 [Shewanella submarina]|uniref:Uncharacterized protein n=1 Tax=Shewanella submarina TaxID=2016376 RepID=A0ABV7GCF0_9GAMM|nr:hypothetical protein [Shewanella submarina]MCL1038659.1 hypothetical protein [Shewanella submarina]
MLSKYQRGLISLGYLTISWSLLLWLHMNIEPNVFAHMVAIPVLMLGTGVSAWRFYNKHCCE